MSDKVTIKQVTTHIKSECPRITCRWIADVQEYRIAVRGVKDTEYFTNDGQDAINTARSMQVWCNETGA